MGTFRERVEIEDALLNTRTGLFLISNSLMMTAAGHLKDTEMAPWVCVIGLLLALIWFCAAQVSRKFINELTRLERDWVNGGGTTTTSAVPDHSKEIWEVRDRLRMGRTPTVTDLLTWLLPLIFLGAWAGALGYVI